MYVAGTSFSGLSSKQKSLIHKQQQQGKTEQTVETILSVTSKLQLEDSFKIEMRCWPLTTVNYLFFSFKCTNVNLVFVSLELFSRSILSLQFSPAPHMFHCHMPVAPGASLFFKVVYGVRAYHAFNKKLAGLIVPIITNHWKYRFDQETL